jgi:hypothetical protein
MRFYAPVIAIVVLASACNAWSAQEWSTPEQDQQAVTELKAFFEDAKIRFPGTRDNKQIEKKMQKLFADSGFQTGEVGFRTPVFRPGKTTLTVGVDNYDLYPMHPALMRPGNFDKDDFGSRLVYVGRGTLDDLDAIRGVDLNDSIALMEFDFSNWYGLLRFGVKGFVFIEPEVCEPGDAVSKVFATEVCVPRFLVRSADGAKLRDACKQSKEKELKINFHAQSSTWENDTLRDLWVLVPGQDEELKKEVCVIEAQMDSNCVVPELAEGAQAGANLFLLARLLKHFQEQPPARTVLLAAVNCRTQYYLGDRMLVEHLCAPQSDVESIRDLFSRDLKLQQMYAGYYRKLGNLLDSRDDSADSLLTEFRTLADATTGKQLSVKAPLVSRMQADLNRYKNREIENRGKDENEANASARKHRNLGSLLNIFNRIGHAATLSEFKEPERSELHGTLAHYVHQLLNDYDTLIKLNQDDIDQSVRNDEVRKALAGRVVRWVLSLEMSWRGRRLGISSSTSWGNPDWRNAFGKKTFELAEGLAEKAGHEKLLADTMTRADLPEGYYFGGPASILYFQNCAPDQLKISVPSFALLDVFSSGGRLFTPSDTFDRLDPHAVGQAYAFCEEYIPALVAMNASMLKLPYVRFANFSTVIRTRAYDPFSPAVLPEIPVDKAFVILRTRNVPAAIQGDVSTNYIALTDARAMATFYSIREWYQTLYSSAYRMDSSYRNVLQAIDMGDREGNISSNLENTRDQTYVMFDCVEFPLRNREDVSAVGAYPISSDAWAPLDAKREAKPAEYSVAGMYCPSTSKRLFIPVASPSPASIFLAPGKRLKLMSDRDVVALNAAPDVPEGEGFSSSREMGPDFFWDAVHDMSVLNHYRLGRLQGVKNNLAEDFLQKGDAAAKAAAEKRSACDYPGFVQSADLALGAERNAYVQIRSITLDMLKGVVFYMALILPFCFFMQKLLFNLVKIEAQIAAFFGLFVVSYVIFRQIHPAFAVAKAPEGILVAFVMGVLAIFVVKILHGRFEGEMTLLFQAFTGATTEVGFSTVGQKAMLIGVNNMRRRQVRTMLTTGTIVLVTFTMLAFSSISQTMYPTMVPVSKTPPPYNGIMYHWSGRTMDEASLGAFNELFHGKGDIIVRRWLIQSHYDKMTFPFHAEASTGKSVDFNAALGLSALEDKFLTDMPLTAGRWFSADDAKEVVLPASIAASLKIDADSLTGAKLQFRDTQLSVVGIVDDEKIRMLKDIDQESILPRKGDLAALGPGVDPAGADIPADEAGAGGGNAAANIMDTMETILLPEKCAAKFGARTYSVSVRLNQANSDIWSNLSTLLIATQARFYVASIDKFAVGEKKKDAAQKDSDTQMMDAGVYYVGSGFNTWFGNL